MGGPRPSVKILAGDEPFFAAIAKRVRRKLDAFLKEIAKQVAEASEYTPACVQFDKRGYVRCLDLTEFPVLRWESGKVLVDCSPLERLEELRIFSMEVDLTVHANKRLRSVTLNFCGMRRLDLLPTQIERLDCAANPLETFEASRFPALRALNCAQTPLETLDVSTLHGLEELECGWNDNGYHLDGGSGPRLTRLVLGDHPKLKRVVAKNHLFRGTPKGKRLRELDVSGLPNLEELDVDDCELRALDLGKNPKLRGLSCRNNSFETLDVSHLHALEELMCGGKQLTRLVLKGAGALREVYCNDAAIAELALSDQTRLELLHLEGCDLRVLDIRAGRKLRELNLSGCRKLKEIKCDERQKQTLPALRAFFKLSKPTNDPAKMDPYALHEFVNHYNWDDGTKKLVKAIRNPNCSLASALLVYWRARPHYFLQFSNDDAAREDATGHEVLPLIREIEKRAREGAYKHHEQIAWVHGDQTDDPYPKIKKRREIPAHMLRLSMVDHDVG